MSAERTGRLTREEIEEYLGEVVHNDDGEMRDRLLAHFDAQEAEIVALRKLLLDLVVVTTRLDENGYCMACDYHRSHHPSHDADCAVVRVDRYLDRARQSEKEKEAADGAR